MKKAKIVMITMFKNEAKVMRRMLESCAPYIDYWVIQNNGSTDGTDQIVKDFFAEVNIPGVLYDVEEGWVGFGWNRDHLIQKCQSIDHGCDWILKMDCDETLEVDPDFDWSLLDNKEVQAFHIPAVSGTCIYHRAWMWNAKLPWRFNHDPCHETIYCEIEEIGNRFQIFDLPPSFRQMGANEGESWSVPTKFMSDALILEEKMLRENTMLTNLYHFWYIGKSYTDCYRSDKFPLGQGQQREYARRSIYYLEEYINLIHGFKTGKKATHIDETSYMSLIFIAEAHLFLGNNEAAIASYKLAEQFAPGRNDHYFGLAQTYQKLGRYEEMLEVTTIMMSPERKNPFPNYCSFIDTSLYMDSPLQRVQNLHNVAVSKASVKDPNYPFMINKLPRKRLFIVDDFYKNPDEIRNFALNVEYKEDLRWYKGLRSTITYRPPNIKQAFESILGEKITVFEEHGMNGCFQITTSEDRQVYHYDAQNWAAMIYLSPLAPIQSGTRLHMSKINNTRDAREYNVDDAFSGMFYDATRFYTTDVAANFYNRLVIMDAKCIHSAGEYFGDSKESGRLTHLFFFD